MHQKSFKLTGLMDSIAMQWDSSNYNETMTEIIGINQWLEGVIMKIEKAMKEYLDFSDWV